MCQTGQTILMPLFESTRGISLQRFDQLVLAVQLYLSLFVYLCACVGGCLLLYLVYWSISDINRHVGLNKNQNTHTYIERGMIWGIAAGRDQPTQIYATFLTGQVESFHSLIL